MTQHDKNVKTTTNPITKPIHQDDKKEICVQSVKKLPQKHKSYI